MSDLVDGLRERADWADYYTDAEFLRRAASHIEAQEKRIYRLEAGLKALRIAHGKGSSTGMAITDLLEATLSQKEENE